MDLINQYWIFLCILKSVCLFNFFFTSEIVAVLKGHTGLVKGVSWDPVGKYLGSQSDDKTVRIWRTVDWSEEAVISKPFEQVIHSIALFLLLLFVLELMLHT